MSEKSARAEFTVSNIEPSCDLEELNSQILAQTATKDDLEMITDAILESSKDTGREGKFRTDLYMLAYLGLKPEVLKSMREDNMNAQTSHQNQTIIDDMISDRLALPAPDEH